MTDEYFVKKLKERESAFNNSPMAKINVDLTSFRKFESLDSQDIIALQNGINSATMPHPVNLPAKFLTYNGHNKITTAYHLKEGRNSYKLDMQSKLPFMNSLCLFSKRDAFEMPLEPRKTEEFIDFSKQIRKCSYQKRKIPFNEDEMMRLNSPKRRKLDIRQQTPRMRAESVLLLQRCTENE